MIQAGSVIVLRRVRGRSRANRNRWKGGSAWERNKQESLRRRRGG
nr:MAG TPA: hypothetical protein [Bacteriophage sp.]